MKVNRKYQKKYQNYLAVCSKNNPVIEGLLKKVEKLQQEIKDARIKLPRARDCESCKQQTLIFSSHDGIYEKNTYVCQVCGHDETYDS